MSKNTISVVPFTSSIRKGPTEAQARPLPSWLSATQAKLLTELFEAYRAYRGSQRHESSSIEQGESNLLDFFSHARGVPGEVQAHHFEAWSNHLYTERHVAASTQRGYQTAVRLFFDYILDEPRLRMAVRRAAGQDPQQVSTPENSIVHCRERELSKNSSRRSFTQAEIQAFLQRTDTEIAMAYQQRSKALHTQQRNKAMFSTVLELGLRASECIGLNIDYFEPNPDFPQLGAFGYARVWGKGSKWRRITCLHPELGEVLQWYVDHVRPLFLCNAAVGERAMFLSERGHRLSYAGFYAQFTRLRTLCLLPRELVPHCLRHTSVSADDMRGLSAEANRQRHGHVYQATTQGYMHHPDSYVRGEIGRALSRNMQASKVAHDNK